MHIHTCLPFNRRRELRKAIQMLLSEDENPIIINDNNDDNCSRCL